MMPPPGACEPRLLELLSSEGVLSPLDYHFARALSALPGADDDSVLAAALASRAVQLGHVCVDVSELDFTQLLPRESSALEGVAWPSGARLLAALSASPLCSQRSAHAVGADEAPLTPLVLDAKGRLYLQRYARYERSLAETLRSRARRMHDVDLELLKAGVERLFAEGDDATAPHEDAPQIDPSQLRAPQNTATREAAGSAPDQARRGSAHRVLACVATLHSLAVICGGPGTGKTTTVVKILALLQEQALARVGLPLDILLLAPTGKAARRLAASVQAGVVGLAVSEAVKAAIPNEASTIHRALGSGASGRFRHDRENPLPADVVLVDEVSMVDLALLYRLTSALRPGARVILQGDKDQLASVEAGAILGDIYDASAAAQWSVELARDVSYITGQALTGTHAATGLWDCLVSLDESYRYRAESGIGRLARAINAGDAAAALATLRSKSSGGSERDAELFEPVLERTAPGREPDELERRAIAGYTAFIQSTEAAEKLARLSDYRILCAHRQGPQGVERINEDVLAWLRRAGLIDGALGFYENRPIIVTQNDYALGLFNGDVGVVVKDREQRLRVCFEGADGLRFLSPGRLPPHETVFATTVHKSQGSEFDAVSIVLPRAPSALVGRELLYTAVTRARRRVDIFASAEVIRSAIAHSVQRPSGLRDALWQMDGAPAGAPHEDELKAG